MDLAEINAEILECARYGESEDLKVLLEHNGDVNFADEGGNTALHKAAANGEVECIKVLSSFGAKRLPNKSGNFPERKILKKLF